jgi:hypothetical protein
MHGLTHHVREILRFPGRGRRALILGALPLVAAGALLAAPAASAGVANLPASHGQAVSSRLADAAAHTTTSLAPAGSPSLCPSTYLCFWVNADWGGAMGKVAGTNPWWGARPAFTQSQCKSGTWNDCASSLVNHGEFDNAIVYQNINYGGGSQCIEIGTTFYIDLAHNTYQSNGQSMNDSISSNQWTSHACS